MLETIVVVLLFLWLFGLFGPWTFPHHWGSNGSLIHLLLVAAIAILIYRLFLLRRP